MKNIHLVCSSRLKNLLTFSLYHLSHCWVEYFHPFICCSLLLCTLNYNTLKFKIMPLIKILWFIFKKFFMFLTKVEYETADNSFMSHRNALALWTVNKLILCQYWTIIHIQWTVKWEHGGAYMCKEQWFELTEQEPCVERWSMHGHRNYRVQGFVLDMHTHGCVCKAEHLSLWGKKKTKKTPWLCTGTALVWCPWCPP